MNQSSVAVARAYMGSKIREKHKAVATSVSQYVTRFIVIQTKNAEFKGFSLYI